MIISDTAVKKSVSVMVLSVIIIAFGTYSYLVLPRESDPDITIPYVFVSTSYRGYKIIRICLVCWSIISQGFSLLK